MYISKKVHSASLSSSVSEQGGLQQEQQSNETKAQELQRMHGSWIFGITETQNNLSSERSYKGSVPTHLSVMRSPCFNITDSVPSTTNYLIFWYLESIWLLVITSGKFGLEPLWIQMFLNYKIIKRTAVRANKTAWYDNNWYLYFVWSKSQVFSEEDIIHLESLLIYCHCPHVYLWCRSLWVLRHVMV